MTFPWRNLALSLALTGLAGVASAQSSDRNGVQSAQRQLDIRNAQQTLKDKGYYSAMVDGMDDAATRDAIRKYQRANNLTVNGRLDRATCDRLGLGSGEANRGADDKASVQDKYGANDTNTVEAAQRQLSRQAMYSGAIDGVMGGKTASAIRDYQRKNGLPVTGVLDRSTLTSLGVSR